MERLLQRNRLKPLQITHRQKQCLDLLTRGYSPKEIGSILFISRRTVNYHLFCLLQRFDAKSYPHLVFLLATMDYFNHASNQYQNQVPA
ncbi:MAG: helix-turn-helix transcriptional regulator [Chloroflexi bacterium]|jgi:DNA-binding CsgD family transcriptional regulator|nr:helix-turn-helix transcriptional regulator [Chloroflexota bacterium]